jgi:hypothetical protein
MFEISALSVTLAHAVVVLATPAVVICSPTGNVGPRPIGDRQAGGDDRECRGRN